MKRNLCLISALVLLLCTTGCANRNQPIQSPISFYYCTPESDYAASRNVITPENRDAEPYSEDMVALLNLYLKGPNSSNLQNPFPENITATEFVLTKTTAKIVLSSHYSKLSGMNLTIACACLSMTIMEYTGCDQVSIFVISSLSGEQECITMAREDLLINYLEEDVSP